MTRLLQASAFAFLAAAFTLPGLLDSGPRYELGSAPPPTHPVGVAPVVHVPTVPVEAAVAPVEPRKPGSGRKPAAYPSDALLDALAACETGGTMDPRAYNPAGPYLGAFQFLQGTWWSVGGEGDPRDHPYEVQRELARTLILQAGWSSQFPVCSRRIGAR